MMGDKNFTQGKWRLGNNGSVVSDCWVRGEEPSKGTLEFYGGSPVCESVVEEDAHLIAAAPEMYDLLYRIAEAYNDSQFGDLAEALLKKARGGL